LPSPLQASWKLITDANHIKHWFGPHVTLDARLNGEFREIWSH
jgi:uncharacterized protein YndB with AHSA1/START domain